MRSFYCYLPTAHVTPWYNYDLFHCVCFFNDLCTPVSASVQNLVCVCLARFLHRCVRQHDSANSSARMPKALFGWRVNFAACFARLTRCFVRSCDAHIFTSPVARKTVIHLGLTKNWWHFRKPMVAFKDWGLQLKDWEIFFHNNNPPTFNSRWRCSSKLVTLEFVCIGDNMSNSAGA